MMYITIYGATIQIKRLVNSFWWRDSKLEIDKRADSTSECSLYDITIYGGFCFSLDEEKDRRLRLWPRGVNLGYVALESGSYIEIEIGYMEV